MLAWHPLPYTANLWRHRQSNRNASFPAIVSTTEKPTDPDGKSLKGAGVSIDALTALAVLAFISGLVAPSFLRAPPDDSVVLRCDRSAVMAANLAHDYRRNARKWREWRQERQLVFERCLNETYQTLR